MITPPGFISITYPSSDAGKDASFNNTNCNIPGPVCFARESWASAPVLTGTEAGSFANMLFSDEGASPAPD